jgi:hypothetical protein
MEALQNNGKTSELYQFWHFSLIFKNIGVGRFESVQPLLLIVILLE